MLSATKSGKFQMTIHIDYDREENKIESILASQSNVIRTLDSIILFLSALFLQKQDETPTCAAYISSKQRSDSKKYPIRDFHKRKLVLMSLTICSVKLRVFFHDFTICEKKHYEMKFIMQIVLLLYYCTIIL